MFENSTWLLLVAGGPVLIAAAIAYALMTRRRLTPREKARQHEAVQDLYEVPPTERTPRRREAESHRP